MTLVINFRQTEAEKLAVLKANREQIISVIKGYTSHRRELIAIMDSLLQSVTNEDILCDLVDPNTLEMDVVQRVRIMCAQFGFCVREVQKSVATQNYFNAQSEEIMKRFNEDN